MSCWKYLTHVERSTMYSLALYGDGIDWYMFAKDGDRSSLDLHALDLQILYFHGTPVRKSLDIWPPFPIAIQYCSFSTFTHDADNLFAALENRGRIRQVDLYLTGLQLGEVATVMQQPFLALLPFSGHGKIGDCLCFPVDS